MPHLEPRARRAPLNSSAVPETPAPSLSIVPDTEPAGGDVSAPRWAAQQVAKAVRSGHWNADRAFDRVLPKELRAVSGQYWTPLPVVRRIVEWLDELDVHTVVDIGSGAGKFCVAAAILGKCRFTGLEQRPSLVASARALARVFGVDDRVTFVEGPFEAAATPVAEAYYLYNPFGDYAFGSSHHDENAVTFDEAGYAHDIGAVTQLLRSAPVGTLVITYHGFGGRVPPSYEEIGVDRKLLRALRLWKKGRGQQEAAGAHRRSPGDRPRIGSVA